MLRGTAAAVLIVSLACPAFAQDRGTLDPKPLPPLEHPNDPKTPAKQLFGRKTTPTRGHTEVLGFYSKGCLAGGKALPINGPTWQVMRLSRNRNWGTPQLINVLEHFAAKVPRVSRWKGILVGDMAQPRGGPMITGHTSHQVGLDADIWLTPMPDYEQSRQEREEKSATMIVREDRLDVDPKVWSPDLLAVIKAAAQEPEVERILVNPAIKKAICRDAKGDRSWLSKIRPFWGHDYHMHVRIKCPANYPECKPQDPPKDEDGCGADLAKWFKPQIVHPPEPVKPAKPKPPIRMADLPAACRTVLNAP
jgi:penicillin-insensitive murein endopeptidase